MSELGLPAKLGALLFVASAPVTLTQLATAADASPDDCQEALTSLAGALPAVGLSLTSHDSSYRLVSSPDAASIVRGYLVKESGTELTRTALETLAIIAYRGPLARSAIEEIRGVASDTMIRNLLGRGLITEAGTSNSSGTPVVYAISQGFLEHFGLASLEQLPPIPEAIGEN
jgi:segregation and condensation protein B